MANPIRRSHQGLGATPNGGNSGSFAAPVRSEPGPPVQLRPLDSDELIDLNDSLTSTLEHEHGWTPQSEEDYDRLNDLVHEVAELRAKEADLLSKFTEVSHTHEGPAELTVDEAYSEALTLREDFEATTSRTYAKGELSPEETTRGTKEYEFRFRAWVDQEIKEDAVHASVRAGIDQLISEMNG